MESNVKEVQTTEESVVFQDNTETEIPNSYNYEGLQSSENTELSPNQNNTDLCKSVIFKFGDSYMCPGCQQTYLYLSNLKRHVQNKHRRLLPILFPLYKTKVQDSQNDGLQTPQNSEQSTEQNITKRKNKKLSHALESVFNSVDNSYVCPECPKAPFYQLYSFKRHVKVKHPCLFLTLFPPKPSHVCDICGKSCKSVAALQYHKNKIHNLTSGMAQHKCPLCPEMFTRVRFNEHFEKSHNLIMKPVKVNFGSFEEFCQWKKAIERVTKSYFVKNNSKSIHKNGAKRQTFICHRTGTFKSEAVMNKRKLKSQGSRKMNAFCPAIMRITITKEGTCQLIFQNKHIGHDNELQHLNLTAEEKKYVADKLASNLNVPISDVLNIIHSSAAKDGAERLCLLNKKDLYNIRVNFLKDNQFYLSAPKLDEKLTNNLRDIHNKHTESEQINADITKIEKGWVITSTDSNEIYLIKEISKLCNCTLVCIYCRVCIDMYSCTCPDSSIEGNMCKHIHFFCAERNKMRDDLNEFLDFNTDMTEISSDSVQFISIQKSNNMPQCSEFLEKDNANFINSEKKSALKKEFSDIIDSITTEEEYKLSESAIQDLTVKLKSVQNHTINLDDDVISATGHPIETVFGNQSTHDHLYSSPIIHKVTKTKQISNCVKDIIKESKQISNSVKDKIKESKQKSNLTDPASRTLILQMRNGGKQGAKICYINFAKTDKK